MAHAEHMLPCFARSHTLHALCTQKRVTWRTNYKFEHVPSRFRYRLHCFVHSIKLRLFTTALRVLGYGRIADKVSHSSL